jgi:hypothetical protein
MYKITPQHVSEIFKLESREICACTGLSIGICNTLRTTILGFLAIINCNLVVYKIRGFARKTHCERLDSHQCTSPLQGMDTSISVLGRPSKGSLSILVIDTISLGAISFSSQCISAIKASCRGTLKSGNAVGISLEGTNTTRASLTSFSKEPSSPVTGNCATLHVGDRKEAIEIVMLGAVGLESAADLIIETNARARSDGTVSQLMVVDELPTFYLRRMVTYQSHQP